MDARIITVTSKGQIAIPKDVREELCIENGSKLFVYVYGDTIMLKVVQMPSPQEIMAKIDKAQEWAKSVDLKESDINKIIKEIRHGK